MPSGTDDKAGFEKIRKHVDVFNEIGKTLTSTLDIKEVLQELMRKIGDIFRPDNWSLLLLDESKNDLYFEIAVGDAAEKIKDMRIKLGEGIAGWTAKTGELLYVPDVHKDPRFNSRLDEASRFTTKSVICVPLKMKDKTLGVIELVNKTDISFESYELEVLSTIADYAAIALENAQNYRRAQELTITDDVTGLYNSRNIFTLMSKEFERSMRYNYNFSLMFFDLDGFKQINDTHGHLVGTQILADVGKIVADNIRKADSAARYGGDEFILIMPMTSKKDAIGVCERIRSVIRNKVFFKAEGLNIRLTASFGIATFPDDAANEGDLMNAADKAMYKVKNTTKDGIALADALPEQKTRKNIDK